MSPLEYAGRIAYSSKKVLQFSYDMAVKYKDAPGVYVECGVAAGAQIIAMAAGAPNKTIYAFDSFEGIPLPSNKDDQMPGIKFLTEAEQKALPNPGEQLLESSGATSVSLEDFKHHINNSIGINFEDGIGFGVTLNLKNGAKIVCRVGWFEEVLPVNNVDNISILRLDGDLYNSTYICLKYLYPKVIKGGIVIIDDWALLGCRAAIYDYFSETTKGFMPLGLQHIKDEKSTVAYWYK